MGELLTSGAFGHLADYVLWWAVFASLVVHTWCFFRFFPRVRYRRTGLVVGNLLVLSCFASAAALIGESYFRFIAVETDAFGVSLPARRWFSIHAKLNSLGCRDKEWSREKPTSVRRIAFVGDSFTYGWGVEDVRNRFSDRLQARFDERAPGKIEVLNVAKPGWGTGDEIQPITDMISLYAVDEIVLCYVPNDIEKLLPKSAGFNPIRPPESAFWNLDASCLLDFLFRRIYLPRVPTVRGYHDWLAAGFDETSIWSRHTQQLRDIAAECKRNDVTLRVALLPFLRTSGERFNASAIHARLLDFFSSESIPVNDLLASLEGQDMRTLVVNPGDAHPNETCHELFAQAMWRAFYAAREP